MNTEIKQFISQELMSENQEVCSQFTSHFNEEIAAFITEMAVAFEKWQEYDKTAGTDKRRAYIAAFLFNALNNLLASMKLFISGYAIPSGNLVRQTLEAIFTAILCSSKKLKVYEQVDEDKFSTTSAGAMVLRHSEKLHLDKKSIQTAMRVYEFYHKFSHPSLMALAHNISFSTSGKTYFGSSFDEKKLAPYKKEIINRLALAKTIATVADRIIKE